MSEAQRYDSSIAAAETACRAGNFSQAERLALDALAADLSDPRAHALYGRVLAAQDRAEEAISAFRKACELDPASVQLKLTLGQLLLAEGEPRAALEQAEAALRIDPKSLPANNLVADALVEDDEAEKAEAHLANLASLFPEDSRVHAKRGIVLAKLGRLEEARKSFLESVEAQPVQGFAYLHLATNIKLTQSDRALIERMEELYQMSSVNEIGKRHLAYGLGKAYDDLGDFEAAMRWFDDANRIDYRLKFGDRPFDRKAYAAEIDWITRTFDRAFLARHGPIGCPDPFPVFIVGMIRSGTTLAEQVLSRHPEVEATGEQNFWPRHWQDPFLQGVFDRSRARETAGRYLAFMRAKAPSAFHGTDKMPANHAYLGLIHLLLPAAPIVHMRRNPADTCLSIYTTPNPARNSIANNRANIVFAYRQYERLMKHWSSVLREGRILELAYEDLVEDQETQTKRLLAYCGLGWDERCLSPQSNSRAVKTPSLWQVRQAVYSTSIGRWRNYEPWLGEFEELL